MFNRVSVKKISAMLSLMLIIAIMVPVMAFAANIGFSKLTYKDGTVSGTVYTDVYAVGEKDGVKDAVYVNVYGGGSLVVSPFTATYSTYADGKYYYDFSKSVTNWQSKLDVNSTVYYDGTVTTSAYQSVNNDSSGSTTRRGGGGGAAFIGSVDGSISVSSDGSVNASALASALANGSVTLKLAGDLALIPASALVDASGKTITIVNDNGSIILPISVLKLEELAKALGIDVNDLIIKVSITKVTGATADAVSAAATALGGTQVADAVDFAVVAVGKDDKTVAVDFGKTYVSRTLNVAKNVDSKHATGVMFNDTTNKLSFVPSTFATADDKTVATLKRNGSSIYTVVELNKSFADVASHWSKADVELLANKLVVDGASATAFEPERNITRAEFAALVVRALGLTQAPTAANFKDVTSDAWYASTVATATYAGIINGYEDNTFRPDAQINREELAAMVIRAVDYANVATNVTDVNSVLGKFKDADKIVWAQKEVAAAVNAGIINGLTDTTIGSAEKATRAQAATMLKRFLGLASFIN
ncbi:S-layer homology domain-containing protein [Paenibacillus piri]|uniref:S-layer homology domain-containing protein n=1 Tax=Paenibacillus piri TaxID=2547395 RepID=UPI0026A7737A